MKTEDIEKLWTAPALNKEKQLAVWNALSSDKILIRIPSFGSDPFLKLLSREKMLEKSFDVLDVGCGAGIYSMAIADKVRSVSGIDFSPRMISTGNGELLRRNISNVSLKQMDWNDADPEKLGLKEKFDLVFVHNSPAVNSCNSFKKIIDCSKKYCALCFFLARVSMPVLAELRRLCGISGESWFHENSLTYMFDILFNLGYEPKFQYDPLKYTMTLSLEDAFIYYTNRVGAEKDLSGEEIKLIKSYLSSIEEEGKISEEMNPTLVTLYFEKIV